MADRMVTRIGKPLVGDQDVCLETDDRNVGNSIMTVLHRPSASSIIALRATRPYDGSRALRSPLVEQRVQHRRFGNLHAVANDALGMAAVFRPGDELGHQPAALTECRVMRPAHGYEIQENSHNAKCLIISTEIANR
jgi:hypothetical protein